MYVRIRPFLPNDGAVARQSSIDILPDGESLRIQGKHVGEAHAFKFDKVFAPSTGQDTVFDEVSEFVQSALDGYHVCLFSYGQTGSGKTHTMQGSGYEAMRGIIPRAVEQILSQAGMMQSQRWTFTMKTSFLEIYNEELRDLLVMVNSDGSTRQRDTRPAPKLAIKRNLEGKSYVEGINMVDIDVENKTNGIAQLESVMAAASRARSVATTKMNAESSRSHAVFMLHLCGSNEESGTTVQGVLNLCDLAGSERLDRSGAALDAQRLKETQAINKSLSFLGDVFTHLANGSKHIPFRNSKLTYLLQDCLSGDGKALMFVNLSPTLGSSNESLRSLRFAQRVNQVELGKATKHVQYGGKGNSSSAKSFLNVDEYMERIKRQIGVDRFEQIYQRGQVLESKPLISTYDDEMAKLDKRIHQKELERRSSLREAEILAAKEKADKDKEAKESARKLMRQLTPEEQSIVTKAIRGIGPPTEILASQDADSVQRSSMQTLNPGQWLNDEIINYFLKNCLAKRDEKLCAKQPGRKRSHFFNSFFVKTMFDDKNNNLSVRNKYNCINVKRWSKKVPGKDIFNLKYILCPINLDNTHWTSAVIFMEEKRIQYYDSLGGTDMSKLKGLLQYVKDEYRAKNGEEMDASEWKLVECTTDTPRQRNGEFDSFSLVCCKYSILNIAIVSLVQSTPFP